MTEVETLRALVRELKEAVENYMGSDPDMPSHAETERALEAILARAEEATRERA